MRYYVKFPLLRAYYALFDSHLSIVAKYGDKNNDKLLRQSSKHKIKIILNFRGLQEGSEYLCKESKINKLKNMPVCI